jgi:hypothetical protein
MSKLLLFVIGLAGGAGGAVAWLLSEPGPGVPAGTPLAERLNELKRRFNAARTEGEIAGKESENRVRHEFETTRLHPDRPGSSTAS